MAYVKKISDPNNPKIKRYKVYYDNGDPVDNGEYFTPEEANERKEEIEREEESPKPGLTL